MSKDCKLTKIKTKQLGSKDICVHIHMLLCCLRPQDVLPQKEEERHEEDIAVSVEEGSAEESVSRKNTK